MMKRQAYIVPQTIWAEAALESMIAASPGNGHGGGPDTSSEVSGEDEAKRGFFDLWDDEDYGYDDVNLWDD